MTLAVLPDMIGDLITHLRAQSLVTDLVSDRISAEMQAKKWSMPAPAITLRKSGRASMIGPLYRTLVDAKCWGRSGYEADQVIAALEPVLIPQDLETPTSFTCAGGTVVSSVECVAGPLALVDPDTTWHYRFATYLITWGGAPTVMDEIEL